MMVHTTIPTINSGISLGQYYTLLFLSSIAPSWDGPQGHTIIGMRTNFGKSEKDGPEFQDEDMAKGL
jgi:hypothetical protein